MTKPSPQTRTSKVTPTKATKTTRASDPKARSGATRAKAEVAVLRAGTPRVATVDRREQIVGVALELLAETSIESLTTRDLATALGLSQPALFRHFKNREALLVGVVEHARAQLEKTAVAIFSAGGAAVGQLEALGVSLLAHAERQPGLPRLLFASTTESAGEVREALRGVVAMQASVVAELVRQGQREGEIDPGLDAGAAATLFVGMLQGLILRWEMGGRDEALAERFQPVFEVWLRGAMPRGEHAAGEVAPASSERARAKASSVVALDVRPLLERGDEPLGAIVGALDGLPKAGVLVVEAPFRPAPLITLLKRRGHAVQVEALGAQHWLVEVVAGGEPDVEDLRDLDAATVAERLGAVAGALEADAVFIARVRGGVPRGLGALLKRRDVKVDALERSDGVTVVRLSRG